MSRPAEGPFGLLLQRLRVEGLGVFYLLVGGLGLGLGLLFTVEL